MICMTLWWVPIPTAPGPSCHGGIPPYDRQVAYKKSPFRKFFYRLKRKYRGLITDLLGKTATQQSSSSLISIARANKKTWYI